MSKQVNFFAAKEDADAFHVWLANTFPTMKLVMSESSRYQANGGVPQTIKPELLGHYTVFLVPPSCEERLTYFPSDSQVTLDLTNSLAVEYSPSVIDDRMDCLKVGRLYWTYSGNIDPSMKKHFRSIFEWIFSHSEPLPEHGSWRIFPKARRFPHLKHWVGQPEPNPLSSRHHS